ncbi:hypothetical protein DFH09DRAFT_1324402 [Mycena vulgaris]|nr:hypothetical protein DFH09DRAFT_1324402 [Mycena vulgaris]
MNFGFGKSPKSPPFAKDRRVPLLRPFFPPHRPNPLTTTTTTRDSPPEPSYTRSPTLLHQLSLLREHPDLDYMFIQPDPLPNQGVVLENPADGTWFRLWMTNAVYDHCQHAVLGMFEKL